MKQEFNFESARGMRFIDYMFVKAIADVKTYRKQDKEAFDSEWHRRRKENVPHNFVFQCDGYDLPIVEAFETLKQHLMKEYDERVNQAALNLVNEKLGGIGTKIETINTLVDQFRCELAEKLGVKINEDDYRR